MTDKHPSVLIISAVNPMHSAGIVAMNFYMALKTTGYDVDFLTKCKVKGHPEFDYIYDLTHWPNYIKYLLEKRSFKRSTAKRKAIPQIGNHVFDYGYEDDAPVPVELILNHIRKQYDVVYIVFWSQFISYSTIEAIYNKLHCQIHLRCVDNQPVTGGCHFINGCQRLSVGCGYCPGLIDGGENDFTHYNIEYRKKVFAEVRPIVYGNTHMQLIYRQSELLRTYNRLETVYPLVDNGHFYDIDKKKARQVLNMPRDKKFILFFGATLLTEERKGMKYLLEALNLFYNKLNEEQRREVLVVIAGYNADEIRKHIKFDVKIVGFVSLEQLPLYYAMANVYLSPSIDDAGPSMVNQSLSCGTPVVAFNIGTALDMIQGENTGYCAQLRDTDDFANGILSIYNSSLDKYKEMCVECRRIAVERTSDEAFAKDFLRIYKKYQNAER